MNIEPLPAPADRRHVPLPLRHDTFLGVCEGLGEDFGISGNWFRVAFGCAMFLNPAAIVGLYFALGLAVALSRRLYPRPLPPVGAEPVEMPRVYERERSPANCGDAAQTGRMAA